MAKSTAQKGVRMTDDTEKKSARSWVTIDPALNRRLKIYAVTHDRAVRAVAEDAIRQYLDTAEKGGKRS
jgi:hypothetical protein